MNETTVDIPDIISSNNVKEQEKKDDLDLIQQAMGFDNNNNGNSNVKVDTDTQNVVPVQEEADILGDLSKSPEKQKSVDLLDLDNNNNDTKKVESHEDELI